MGRGKGPFNLLEKEGLIHLIKYEINESRKGSENGLDDEVEDEVEAEVETEDSFSERIQNLSFCSKDYLEGLQSLIEGLVEKTDEYSHPRNRLYNRGRLDTQFRYKLETEVKNKESSLTTSEMIETQVKKPESESKSVSQIYSTLSHEAPEFVPKGSTVQAGGAATTTVTTIAKGQNMSGRCSDGAASMGSISSASSQNNVASNQNKPKKFIVPAPKTIIESPQKITTEVEPLYSLAICNYVLTYGHLPPNFVPEEHPPEPIRTARDMFLHHESQLVLYQLQNSPAKNKSHQFGSSNPNFLMNNGVNRIPVAAPMVGFYHPSVMISAHPPQQQPLFNGLPIPTRPPNFGQFQFHQANSVAHYQQQFSPVKIPRQFGTMPNGQSITTSRICIYCKSIGQSRDMYYSHSTRNPSNGKAVCPLLRKLKCDKCGATGDKAHSDNECPFNLITARKETLSKPEISRKLSFTSSIEKINDNLKNSARFI